MTKCIFQTAIRTPVQSGFTLVELLVCIAIIGVLITLMLPALGQARDQARKIACASQQRQIATASTAYAQDNKQWLQGTNYYQPFLPTERFMGYLGYAPTALYSTQLRRMPVIRCPNTRNATTVGSTASHTPGTNWPGTDRYVASYFFPGSWADYPADVSGVFYGWQSSWVGQSTSRVPDTSAPCPNIEFAGTVRKGPNPGVSIGMTMWIEVPSQQPMIVDGYAGRGLTWSIATTGTYFSNHDDGLNVMFIDGHGEYRTTPYVKQRHRAIYW